MRTVGVVVEYNPFHNGHQLHLRESRAASAAEAVVAVMSGPFLQRGEPALVDKWLRAEMALRGGCDLVLELPVAYATQAAEWFAYGAMATLEATGVVDSVCFGSESGDLKALQCIARTLADEPPAFRSELRQLLQRGLQYPAAYSEAVVRYMRAIGEPEAAAFPLAQPNNTLGLHYMLALERLGSPILPLTIRRQKAGYHEQQPQDSRIASATALRRMLESGAALDELAPYVPATTLQLLQTAATEPGGCRSWPDYFPQLLHALLTHTPDSLFAIREMNEGLEHRILHALPRLKTLGYEELVQAVATRRYTRTKLQRALLAVLLGQQKHAQTPDMLRSGVDYIRVLGFNATGRRLLRRMRTTASLPILLSAARAPEGLRYLELDVRASAIYAAAPKNATTGELYRDFYAAPIQI
ncbi:nucleotidyltransferase [Paenibacillus sp. IB182496]|uniref:tRNA(Met) cytidine acetate ligase n=1 Tax=Paenibacillus sabuli TaxID=2772509 RepID=A0A927BVI5_9BACL|nr:nucleotidyltransferase [Paenibacillus sabuli]MBD2846128.1 nucleotidyltransferase [Paenibacillus sabuli]